ncbi:class I SAM-dependent methyltransferase [Thermoactinomyces sp. DSM 45892]|uniref:tRNA (adenine(22)-N(1))-methyltransferase n=1 Tax=Thermoactinomyces sp. DSM 45892 TaxID=1882753 RepID=UPI0008962106|nr:class I SAM-dependent methyltransferase [Thermoactinomyces sp. DSM 45892]SDY67985.1 tRNA (adenine22-N1)-methyltransferase [Thermoactinomyces sp. DSM 45892]
MEAGNLHTSEPVHLSERLAKIASWILPDCRVADIGGDHGWLLLSVAQKGLLGQGIIGEVNKGPFENAAGRIQAYGLGQQIDVRLGDGLSVLRDGEVDQIVIAGMGGALITSILDAGKSKLESVKRLVLQPNIGGHRVRQWLVANRWKLIHEEIVYDAEIYYEMIVAERGAEDVYENQPIPRLILERIGPLLWRNRDPLLRAKMQEELGQMQKVYKQLSNGQSGQAIQRRRELEREMEMWEQVMNWLYEEQN